MSKVKSSVFFVYSCLLRKKTCVVLYCKIENWVTCSFGIQRNSNLNVGCLQHSPISQKSIHLMSSHSFFWWLCYLNSNSKIEWFAAKFPFCIKMLAQSWKFGVSHHFFGCKLQYWMRWASNTLFLRDKTWYQQNDIQKE